jgi:hypothetical protein
MFGYEWYEPTKLSSPFLLNVEKMHCRNGVPMKFRFFGQGFWGSNIV